MKRLLCETLLVAGVGALLALAANAISPRGLKVNRDYFPKLIPNATPVAASPTNSVDATATTNAAVADVHAEKLRALGLQVVSLEQAAEWFRDPRTELGLVVFIDARESKHFQAGHIPGAYAFDHYRPEQYLPTVLPVVQTAEQIIIYCNGGDCEDSQFAAIFLRDSVGIAPEKLFVFAEGFEKWSAKPLPVEIGERGSGVMK